MTGTSEKAESTLVNMSDEDILAMLDAEGPWGAPEFNYECWWQTIDDFSKLEAGWYWGQGEPITLSVREEAKSIAKLICEVSPSCEPAIAPGVEGSIMIEPQEIGGWSWSFEIMKNSVEIFGVDLSEKQGSEAEGIYDHGQHEEIRAAAQKIFAGPEYQFPFFKETANA